MFSLPSRGSPLCFSHPTDVRSEPMSRPHIPMEGLRAPLLGKRNQIRDLVPPSLIYTCMGPRASNWRERNRWRKVDIVKKIKKLSKVLSKNMCYIGLWAVCLCPSPHFTCWTLPLNAKGFGERTSGWWSGDLKVELVPLWKGSHRNQAMPVRTSASWPLVFIPCLPRRHQMNVSPCKLYFSEWNSQQTPKIGWHLSLCCVW